jgi:hypothetical protein
LARDRLRNTNAQYFFWEKIYLLEVSAPNVGWSRSASENVDHVFCTFPTMKEALDNFERNGEDAWNALLNEYSDRG